MTDQMLSTTFWWGLYDLCRGAVADLDDFACSAALAIEGQGKWTTVELLGPDASRHEGASTEHLTFLQHVWVRTEEVRKRAKTAGADESDALSSVTALANASGLLRGEVVRKLGERLQSAKDSPDAQKRSLALALSQFDVRPSRVEADLALYRGPGDLCQAVLGALKPSAESVYLPFITDRRQAAIVGANSTSVVIQGPTHQQVLRGALLFELLGVDCTWRIEDPLQNPVVEGGRLRYFDATLIVPPMGSRGRFATPPELSLDPRVEYRFDEKTPSELLHLIHAVESTDPDHGMVLAVLPDSVLFRGGPLAPIRSSLVHRAPLVLTHVISMPTAFAGTGVSASLVVLQPDSPTSDVRFIDAQPFVEGRGDRAKYDIKGVVELLSAMTSEPGLVAVTPRAEVLTGDKSWDVRRYIKPKAVETVAPVEARRLALEASEERDRAESDLLQALERLRGVEE